MRLTHLLLLLPLFATVVFADGEDLGGDPGGDGTPPPDPTPDSTPPSAQSAGPVPTVSATYEQPEPDDSKIPAGDTVYDTTPGYSESPKPCELAPAASSSAYKSTETFCNGERFGLYNPLKHLCLATKTEKSIMSRLRSVFSSRSSTQTKLITKNCNNQMAFLRDSELTFYWKRGDENGNNNLAANRDGKELCARHELLGTYFYPCDRKSSLYQLSKVLTKGKFAGTFKIRDAGKNNACIHASTFFHYARMKGCSKVKNQQWVKVLARA